jgi:hypothetical protein
VIVEGLWKDLHSIVSAWVLDHPDLLPDELVDDLHDYVLEAYGPPREEDRVHA